MSIFANNSTNKQIKPVDWKEFYKNSSLQAPCELSNCQTWITISIPENTQVVYPRPVVKLTRLKPLEIREKPPVSIENSIFLPQLPIPQPPIVVRPPKNQKIPQTTTMASSNLNPSTTIVYPPDFVFSTSWILPLRRVTLSPISNKTGKLPSPYIEKKNLPTPGPPQSSLTTSKASLSSGVWGKSFTLKPRPKVPGIVPQPNSGVEGEPYPSGGMPPTIVSETNFKNTKPKPWTHSSITSDKNSKGSRNTNRSKNRPQLPIAETSIEQAAVQVIIINLNKCVFL